MSQLAHLGQIAGLSITADSWFSTRNYSPSGRARRYADVLDVNNIDVDSVNVGTKVVFQDIENNNKNDYTILGPWDADFANKILSYRSPIAKSLLGKKVGDVVELKLDDDLRKFQIKSIEKYI